jgi:hypothetical protein
MSRGPLLLVSLLAVVLVGFGLSGTSSASFTARTVNGSTITAADDWTPPVVAVENPGATVSGTVDVVAVAGDADSGIAHVAIQYAAAGAGWTTLCTTTSVPYRCSWVTTTTPDGTYLLRAVATDRAGYTTTSSTVSTSVVNTVGVVLAHPGDIVRGNVPLTATVRNSGGLAVSVSIQYRSVDSAGAWSTVSGCTSTTSTLACTWNTTTVVSDFYDLRTVAVVGGKTYTDVVTNVLIDNAAPTVTMVDPGSPLRGTVTLIANAADDESGVVNVAVEFARTGTSTWGSACTISAEPYSCRFDTSTLSDGSYSFRATATDGAGNSRTSVLVPSRIVDNSVASVSMEDPGAFLSGVVTLAASATSSRGVASVTIQRRGSTGVFTDVCVDTATPYTCSWNTVTEADGLYDLRAVLRDGQGATLTSTTVTARRVDNNPLRALDIQSVNGGTKAGQLDAGDRIVFTYSEVVHPASLMSGWDGSPRNVTVTVTDGAQVGGSNIDDRLSVGGVNLGQVSLRQNYVKPKRKSMTAASTMAVSTATVNGVPRTVVTVTLGTPTAGAGASTSVPAAMVWSPSASAANLAGRPCSPAPATESGTNDLDF